MSSPEELLAEFLRSFSIQDLTDGLGPQLAEKARRLLPELASLPPGALESLLAGAAAHGVAQLFQTIELSLIIDGPPPDPSHAALHSTIENVRTALARISPQGPQAALLTREDRCLLAAQAIEILTHTVDAWDRSLDPG